MPTPFLRAMLVAVALSAGCSGTVWNDPHPAADRNANVLYSVFVERPKHLDPAQSYASDEAVFTRQIYEPPLQYHYLKRPYTLMPLAATGVPEPKEIEGGKFTVYEIRIKPGIRFQPHPAFNPKHQALDRKTIEQLRRPYDLPDPASRELDADDYIYQIKRLAHPRVHSPIFGLMAQYIVGLREYAERLKKAEKEGEWLDLRKFPLEGVERVDAYTYRVKLIGRYPQFVYWLAMPFFAPVPWEVEKFFHQPGMVE